MSLLKTTVNLLRATPRTRCLRKGEVVTGRGPIRFDQHQNAILNVQIRQVREVEGKIQNVVLEVIPGVDQYWKPLR